MGLPVWTVCPLGAGAAYSSLFFPLSILCLGCSEPPRLLVDRKDDRAAAGGSRQLSKHGCTQWFPCFHVCTSRLEGLPALVRWCQASSHPHLTMSGSRSLCHVACDLHPCPFAPPALISSASFSPPQAAPAMLPTVVPQTSKHTPTSRPLQVPLFPLGILYP